MKSISSPQILVLGAEGMLGHTVYHFLKKKHPTSVFGTSHTANTPFLLFQAKTAEKDINTILKAIGHIDYVINCIGKLQNCESIKELIFVNALFPQILSEIAKKKHFSIFHISTDAVFANNKENANESTIVSPANVYGASKLLGEAISPHVLTIRTSLIGLDPHNHKGLLEWALRCTKHPPLRGFSNHIWSGATTLQIAEFFGTIIAKNLFNGITQKTSLLHFAPLDPVTKYDLLRTFLHVLQTSTPIEKIKESYAVTRYLTTKYPELIPTPNTQNLLDAIAQLLSFEKDTGYNIIVDR